MNFTPIEKWAEQIGQSPRWVRNHIASGEILAVKIGGSYFITDELIAAMSVRAIPSETDNHSEGWGQITRSAS